MISVAGQVMKTRQKNHKPRVFMIFSFYGSETDESSATVAHHLILGNF